MVSTWTGRSRDNLRDITPHQLLVAIDRLQALHLASTGLEDVFPDFLGDLIALTNSETGYLVEIVPGSHGQQLPGRHFGEERIPNGDTVLRETLLTSRVVFRSFPSENQHATPRLHPLTELLGLPLTNGAGLVGVVVLAGRPGGYDEELVEFLRPLLMTATVIVQARQQLLQHRQRAEQLKETERRFHDVLGTVNDIAWSVSLPDRKMLYLSPGAEELYAIPSAQLLADPNRFLRVVHPEDVEHVRKASADVLLRGAGSSTFRIVRPDGQLRWIQCRARVSFDVQGRPVRVNGIHTDITDLKSMEDALRETQVGLEQLVAERTILLSEEVVQRRQAEEQLRESERHFRLLAENSSDIISLHTAEGVYLYVTPNCVATIGFEPTELVFRSPYEFFHPDDIPAVRATHNRMLSSNEVGRVEYRHRTRANDYTWLETTCRAIRNERGDVTEIVCVSRDVTPRRQIELALRQSEAKVVAVEEKLQLEGRLQEALKRESLSVLAGGVAHEFNNLLTAILGFADLARVQLEPEHPIAGYLEQILRSSQRAAQLTRQMLAYSGKGRFILAPVQMENLLRDMESLLRATVSHNCELTLERGITQPVEADPSQMRQLVLNLVVNASEALGESGGTVLVKAGMTHDIRPGDGTGEDPLPPGEYVLLTVIDNGSGMTDEVRTKMFDPFYSTKFMGRGLGLAAVQGIVRAHGGAIRVATELGKGTMIRVLLPPCGSLTRTTEQAQSPPPSPEL